MAKLGDLLVASVAEFNEGTILQCQLAVARPRSLHDHERHVASLEYVVRHVMQLANPTQIALFHLAFSPT